MDALLPKIRADFSQDLSAPIRVLSYTVEWAELEHTHWECYILLPRASLSLFQYLATACSCGGILCACRQWLPLLHPSHTPGTLACFSIARPHLCPDLTQGCGVEWGGGCAVAFACSNWVVQWDAAANASLCTLMVSKPAHIHSLQVEAPLALLSVSVGFSARRATRLLCAGPQNWDAKTMAQTTHSIVPGPSPVDLLFLIHPTQECRSWPNVLGFVLF